MRKQPIETTPLAVLQEWIAQANTAVDGTMDFAGQRIRLCVKIGQALSAWKKRVGYGHWQTWLAENLEVKYNTARKWIRLGEDSRSGRLDLSLAKSVRQAYILAGLLPESTGGVSQHGEKPVSYLVHSARLVDVLRQMNVAQLSTEEVGMLRERLRPVVEFFHALPA